MDNEYDYNFEEEGIGTRGCLSLVIVLVLVLILLAGCFWWWKNYFQEDGLNNSKVIVEIDNGSDYMVAEDGSVILKSENNDNNDDSSDDFADANENDEELKVAVEKPETKVVVIEKKEKDAKGKKKDYSKLSKSLTEEYTSDDYEFNYAEGWTIVSPSKGFKVLTLRNGDSKLEIFQMSDFGGNRNFSFEGNESEKDVDLNVPKKVLKVTDKSETYNLWMYYPSGDDSAKVELEKIVDTFDIN